MRPAALSMRLGPDADAGARASSRHGGVVARQLAGRGGAADLRPGQPRMGARRALARLLDAAGGNCWQHPLPVQKIASKGMGCVNATAEVTTRGSNDSSTQSLGSTPGVWALMHVCWTPPVELAGSSLDRCEPEIC